MSKSKNEARREEYTPIGVLNGLIEKLKTAIKASNESSLYYKNAQLLRAAIEDFDTTMGTLSKFKITSEQVKTVNDLKSQVRELHVEAVTQLDIVELKAKDKPLPTEEQIRSRAKELAEGAKATVEGVQELDKITDAIKAATKFIASTKDQLLEVEKAIEAVKTAASGPSRDAALIQAKKARTILNQVVSQVTLGYKEARGIATIREAFDSKSQSIFSPKIEEFKAAKIEWETASTQFNTRAREADGALTTGTKALRSAELAELENKKLKVFQKAVQQKKEFEAVIRPIQEIYNDLKKEIGPEAEFETEDARVAARELITFMDRAINKLSNDLEKGVPEKTATANFIKPCKAMLAHVTPKFENDLGTWEKVKNFFKDLANLLKGHYSTSKWKIVEPKSHEAFKTMKTELGRIIPDRGNEKPEPSEPSEPSEPPKAR